LLTVKIKLANEICYGISEMATTNYIVNDVLLEDILAQTLPVVYMMLITVVYGNHITNVARHIINQSWMQL